MIDEIEVDRLLELACGYWKPMHVYFAANPKYRKLQVVAWKKALCKAQVSYDEAIKAMVKYATTPAGVFEPKVANIIETVKAMR